MWSAQSLRNFAEREAGPKQREMTARKFCVIQTISIRYVGKYSLCLDSFSISPDLTLSAKAKFFSFSNLDALSDFVLGQKKILIARGGASGKIQKKYPFHWFAMKEVPGLNVTLSRWLFLLRKFL
jgi:hypothetical protein